MPIDTSLESKPNGADDSPAIRSVSIDEKQTVGVVATKLGLNGHQFHRAGRSHIAFHGVLRDIGFVFHNEMKILDVGCGAGTRVCAYRCAGLDAYGIDLQRQFGEAEQLCRDERWSSAHESVFRMLDLKDYRFPFESDTFDLVYSDQLLEHVTNLGEVISEVHRVLKPGGVSLHVYPPPWIAVEPHVYVPFGGRFPYRSYLRLWAKLGVRKASQKGLSSREIVERNYAYLRDFTCYRSAKEVEQTCHKYFDDVRHVNHLFIKHVPRAIRYSYPALRLLPFSRMLIGTFLQRALLLVKQA